MPRIFVIVFLIGAIAPPASADGLTPLSQVMKSGPNPDYLLVRCAAFYQANAEWGGKQRLGKEYIAKVDQILKGLLSLAILGRVESKMGSTDHVTQVTLRDTRNIADLYLERFEMSYASTGHAWSGDPLWEADARECKYLTEKLAKK
ncbi:MAG: hypothetical protein GEU87_10600 [Alphaproteobacteria bacterium]|nr:hypothetical protein [Alphaproteobacteria bacterium]